MSARYLSQFIFAIAGFWHDDRTRLASGRCAPAALDFIGGRLKLLRGFWPNRLGELTCRIRAGLLWALGCSVIFLSTAIIPVIRHVPPVIRRDSQPASFAIAQFHPELLTGHHSVANYLHQSISVTGMGRDQVRRLILTTDLAAYLAPCAVGTRALCGVGTVAE